MKFRTSPLREKTIRHYHKKLKFETVAFQDIKSKINESTNLPENSYWGQIRTSLRDAFLEIGRKYKLTVIAIDIDPVNKREAGYDMAFFNYSDPLKGFANQVHQYGSLIVTDDGCIKVVVDYIDEAAGIEKELGTFENNIDLIDAVCKELVEVHPEVKSK